MKKLLLIGLLQLALVGCASSATVETSGYNLEFTDEAKAMCDANAINLGFKLKEYVEVTEEGAFTFYNCYREDGTKVSFVYVSSDNKLILVYDPDDSFVYKGDTSVDCILALKNYTRLNTELYVSNMAKLQNTPFVKSSASIVSVIGDHKIVRIDGSDIITEGTLFHTDGSKKVTGSEFSGVNLASYRPLMFECFYKKQNASYFNDLTTIQVPISASSILNDISHYSTSTELEDYKLELDKFNVNELVTTPVMEVDEALNITDETPMSISIELVDGVTSGVYTDIMSQFGAPNTLYTSLADTGWINYVSIYKICDDEASDFIKISFDEALGDMSHIIRNFKIEYYNAAKADTFSISSDAIYSSDGLMEDIKNYGG